MGSVAGVCIAAVLLWTAWGKDPLRLFTQEPAPTPELASASPIKVQAPSERQATKPDQPRQDKLQKPEPSSTADVLAQVDGSTATELDAETLVVPDENSDVSHAGPDKSNNGESPKTDLESEPVTDGRLAVPSQADQEQALATIKSLFEEQYRVAKTKEQKLNLASEMIKVSEDTNEDIAGKYVLLRVARDIAIAQLEIDLTEASIARIESSFSVDGTELRIEAWQALLSNTATTGAKQKTISKKIVSQILQHAEQLFYDTDYEAALATIKFADAKFPAFLNEQERESFNRLKKAAETRQELLASKSAAELVLDTDPLDPDANEKLGRYYCFYQGDWQAGLLYLSRCGDESLRRLAADEMAALDLANPTTQALGLGNRWWEYSDTLGDDESTEAIAKQIKLHASTWYKQTQTTVTGLTKKLIEKRLAEANSLSASEYVKEANTEIPTKLDHSKLDLVPSMFKGRSGAMKATLLERYGGSQETQNAVKLGLEWLKRNQKSNGSWSMRGPYNAGGFTENAIAATAMALLAYLGDGHTHKKGEYADVVEQGMKFLVSQQDSEGFFAKNARSHEKMYAQAQATIALCEILGMSGDKEFHNHSQRAIDYAVESQSDAGGWRYEPRVDSDTSVTGWYVMALLSGRAAGLKVRDSCLESVMQYLDNAGSKDGTAYGYQAKSAPSSAMTAEGLLCRQYLGWKRDHPPMVNGVSALVSDAPFDIAKQDVYYWYYATQAFHHFGGLPWRRWNDAMKVELPKAQVTADRESGSWAPQRDRWGKNSGRLYTTCLSLYCLEAYYRHLPIYDTRSEAASNE